MLNGVWAAVETVVEYETADPPDATVTSTSRPWLDSPVTTLRTPIWQENPVPAPRAARQLVPAARISDSGSSGGIDQKEGGFTHGLDGTHISPTFTRPRRF